MQRHRLYKATVTTHNGSGTDFLSHCAPSHLPSHYTVIAVGSQSRKLGLFFMKVRESNPISILCILRRGYTTFSRCPSDAILHLHRVATDLQCIEFPMHQGPRRIRGYRFHIPIELDWNILSLKATGRLSATPSYYALCQPTSFLPLHSWLSTPV